jgi:phenylpyruvate tautomerase PptA (4-oxalocrotonate tautomerase family)
MKENFMSRIMALLSEYTGVDAKDIHGVIYEIPPGNYLGGVPHKYINV